mmetsp:Transcript_22162/g.34441  ORF Transcript_22162/g.34441 Transcript_22162/m.34441 type:complete len:102 (+) Transcript_22162:348-653(+)
MKATALGGQQRLSNMADSGGHPLNERRWTDDSLHLGRQQRLFCEQRWLLADGGGQIVEAIGNWRWFPSWRTAVVSTDMGVSWRTVATGLSADGGGQTAVGR